jgi:hypothetical protein
MKTSLSLFLALLVSSVSVAQISFADEMSADSIESASEATMSDELSANALDLGSDSLVESPSIRDHRGSRGPIIRGPMRPIGHPGGGVVVRPMPRRPVPRPPVVVRPMPRPGRVIVRGPRPPVVIRGGIYGWPVFRHRTVVSRVYPFIWNRLQSVTCTSINNYGEEFSVTESGYYGDAYYPIMVNVENAAVDRCYAETGGDMSCRILTCAPTYY